MTIVWDLDYTLLDTVKFKEALKEAVTSLGVSPERYEETYAQIVKREGKTYDYDPSVHVEALRDDLGSEEKMAEALAGIEGVLSRTEEFLYPGAAEMLREYKTAGARQVLLTLGNEQWQEAKVRHSGLTELFDEVRAVGKGKAGVLKEIVRKDERTFVINDNAVEILEMLEESEKARQRGEPGMDDLRFVLKKGPKPVPADLALPQAELEEVARLLDEELGIDRRDSREGRPTLR